MQESLRGRTATIIQTIVDLFEEIDKHFVTSSRLEQAIALAEKRVRKEAWFRGQLFCLFAALQEQGRLSNDWEIEAPFSKILSLSAASPSASQKSEKWIDFRVTVNGEPIYLELKALYLGPRGNQGLKNYPSTYPNFLKEDVLKLNQCKQGRKFCVLFVYPSPESSLWNSFVSTMENKYAPIRIKQFDPANLENYPSSLYLAKLEVF